MCLHVLEAAAPERSNIGGRGREHQNGEPAFGSAVRAAGQGKPPISSSGSRKREKTQQRTSSPGGNVQPGSDVRWSALASMRWRRGNGSRRYGSSEVRADQRRVRRSISQWATRNGPKRVSLDGLLQLGIGRRRHCFRWRCEGGLGRDRGWGTTSARGASLSCWAEILTPAATKPQSAEAAYGGLCRRHEARPEAHLYHSPELKLHRSHRRRDQPRRLHDLLVFEAVSDDLKADRQASTVLWIDCGTVVGVSGPLQSSPSPDVH